MLRVLIVVWRVLSGAVKLAIKIDNTTVAVAKLLFLAIGILPWFYKSHFTITIKAYEQNMHDPFSLDQTASAIVFIVIVAACLAVAYSRLPTLAFAGTTTWRRQSTDFYGIRVTNASWGTSVKGCTVELISTTPATVEGVLLFHHGRRDVVESITLDPRDTRTFALFSIDYDRRLRIGNEPDSYGHEVALREYTAVVKFSGENIPPTLHTIKYIPPSEAEHPKAQDAPDFYAIRPVGDAAGNAI